MSLNGWGGKLHAPLISFLQSMDPDILCLQEVVHTPATHKDWLTYRDGDHVLQQRANFFTDVSIALPGHASCFCPASQGVLWDGLDTVPSQWGLATFVRKTVPVVAQIQNFVHGRFSLDGYGDHPRSRNAHAIRVYDFDAGRFVTIAHMHGLRDLRGKIDTPERDLQAERMAKLIDSVSEPGDAVVLCGDFNVEPDSTTFSAFEMLDLIELVTTGGFAGTRTSFYQKPGRFADYMLIDRQTPVKDFRVIVEPEVSDHCPLHLEI